EKHGPESMALFTHGAGGSFFKTLLKAYGSNNIVAPSYGNCRGPREEAYLLTVGDAINSPECTDMKNSNCIVLIGSHIGENTHSAQVNEFTQAIAKGASVIVVDPRFSTAASKAKYWLPIKPETDMALLLAWINVIINEELYDKKYVKKYTLGFEKLKNEVKKNTPEWAYPITSIKPEIIRATAREMAKNAPGTLIHPGRHSVWHGNDTQRARAGAILNALLGSWGKKGGFYLAKKAKVPKYPIPKFPKPQKTWRDTNDGKYELANLALTSGICDATMPSGINGQNIKGWLVYGSNLIKTLPERKKVIDAIQNLDLMVAIDILPAEITGYADVVLPECTYLERTDPVKTFGGVEPSIAQRNKVVEPMFESKPVMEIMHGL
ncbi:MAG: molybdopterin-dependent oxidoreductase, partial [Calditrichia bacterium]|nr:molybdopterin-dependent oxidoreductase [Calditrichia bacterium]